MSSMDRLPFIALALAVMPAMTASAPVTAQDAESWDRARQNMIARAPSRIAPAISQWERLTASRDLRFDDYAGFVLAYPDFPREETLRIRAENALDREPVGAERLVAFFDRNPPLTNSGRARYALALASLERPEAFEWAREAWRNGRLDGTAEAYLSARYAARFQQADHDQRLDALLWQGETEAARRTLTMASPQARTVAEARLDLLENAPNAAANLGAFGSDPGYVYNLSQQQRRMGRMDLAVSTLSNATSFSKPAYDAEAMIAEMLQVARSAPPAAASRIAANADAIFADGTDISDLSYRLRDDYTSLMWHGGTEALWSNGNPASAAPLFYHYGTAAKTPQTRSKGFYWAGLASERAGNTAGANRYFEMASEYADRFYGQLALEKLGRPLPSLKGQGQTALSPEAYRQFSSEPLVEATREVSRGAPWSTGIQFYRALAQRADTPAEHRLVADFAREIGRRDLAVNVAEAAGADGHSAFVEQGFPVLDTPPGANWIMVHAIARQESQFADNAISHAGARGLMQLMPATAQEQSGKLGMTYMTADLIGKPDYNIRLGDAYFARMLDYFDGAYPLAIAAYNAGPGNVNKWLRANGDPRTGSIDYVTWIERIPIFETKNYVQRVIENASVYAALHPERVRSGHPQRAGEFLRK
ncbi:transglycosylase SLT domain-containing protein [Altererythrobacter aurantiacus]|uniref:Transglycosylase SLT domain-containing protein n=1 Tax=Parapontixanthobacter aurantiacus TaxID=1463599 RepID=A0A844ZEX3_9SPHN|nr:transglycosylase SLT domain-containing protein [Parapontixanthobacter aurantiacus]